MEEAFQKRWSSRRWKWKKEEHNTQTQKELFFLFLHCPSVQLADVQLVRVQSPVTGPAEQLKSPKAKLTVFGSVELTRLDHLLICVS